MSYILRVRIISHTQYYIHLQIFRKILFLQTRKSKEQAPAVGSHPPTLCVSGPGVIIHRVYLCSTELWYLIWCILHRPYISIFPQQNTSLTSQQRRTHLTWCSWDRESIIPSVCIDQEEESLTLNHNLSFKSCLVGENSLDTLSIFVFNSSWWWITLLIAF